MKLTAAASVAAPLSTGRRACTSPVEMGVELVPAGEAVTMRVTFETEDGFPVERRRRGWQAIFDRYARYGDAGGQEA